MAQWLETGHTRSGPNDKPAELNCVNGMWKKEEVGESHASCEVFTPASSFLGGKVQHHPSHIDGKTKARPPTGQLEQQQNYAQVVVQQT
ncbi:uncharacterized protein CCOS01_10535 [Colletotrichum costaricense]|uniref:Uncharacterized protein n=1 Tax=Colletotrichum costaricense TaxID=1209916 RepID=A0AAJ0DY93_9PEZI|nr:uncharacterized protein CCOS01_10535 [Colletotrichum costaricense]KAK1520416.1 hypothetical protein CCOS01_10535 [Colletotrichum costaricense]